MQEQILLTCNECKNRWYSTVKNKKNVTNRLELKKYCKFCRKRTVHKEAK
ncbi:MAG: 50S ribosomal protein L33 [Candidatus Omnitrophota bacterium]|nr:MAG: 50S ribosomal protein L33 [Candidatus Omnitrophota bacterium]